MVKKTIKVGSEKSEPGTLHIMSKDKSGRPSFHKGDELSEFMGRSCNQALKRNQPNPIISELELHLFCQIRKMIQDDKSLLKASICMGVNVRSLRRIMSGESVSRYILKKISAELKKGVNPDNFISQSAFAKKLLLIFQLYQEKRSLGKVGRIMNVSRERIRQLLKKGTELGLYEYRKLDGLPLPDVLKAKIMEDYKDLLSLKEVAVRNNISISQLYKLVGIYRIGREELDAIRNKEKKYKCIYQYCSIVRRLKHPPSTAELQSTDDGKSLSYKISRLWGSIHTFRQELNISFTPRYGKNLKRISYNTIASSPQYSK